VLSDFANSHRESQLLNMNLLLACGTIVLGNNSQLVTPTEAAPYALNTEALLQCSQNYIAADGTSGNGLCGSSGDWLWGATGDDSQLQCFQGKQRIKAH